MLSISPAFYAPEFDRRRFDPIIDFEGKSKEVLHVDVVSWIFWLMFLDDAFLRIFGYSITFSDFVDFEGEICVPTSVSFLIGVKIKVFYTSNSLRSALSISTIPILTSGSLIIICSARLFKKTIDLL